jgi:PAS domain S-box-containing protein
LPICLYYIILNYPEDTILMSLDGKMISFVKHISLCFLKDSRSKSLVYNNEEKECMREKFEHQDAVKKEKQSCSSDIQASRSISRAQYIVLGPLLCLGRAFLDRVIVMLSSMTRWRRLPIMGYLIALLLQVISVGITLLLVHIFHDFAFPGLLSILVALIVASGWGAGPSLFSILVGAGLCNYFLIFPSFVWSWQQITETGLFLLVGGTISLLAVRTKHARLKAEMLVAQLQAEQEELSQAKRETDVQVHRLEAIFEAVTDLLLVLDIDEKIIFANAAFRTLVGDHTSLDYFSQSLQERGRFFCPQDEYGNSLSKEQWPVTRILKGEVLTGASTVDVSITMPDSQIRFMNMGGAPIHDSNGQISGAVIVSRDVTQRRQLERQMQETLESLRESESRFRRLFESNTLGIHFASVNGIITESNDAFLQMIGFTRQEMQEGRLRWDEITPAEYQEADRRAVAQLQAKGVCTPYEKEYLRRDGSRVFVLLGIALLEGSEEEVIAYALDLTERKRLEAALRRAQRETSEWASELEAIFEAITDQVLVYDREGQLIHLNKAARNFNRQNSQPLYLVHSLKERLEPYIIRNRQGEAISFDQLPISRILRGEVLSSVNAEDVWLTLPDGREVLLNVTGAPFYDDQGQLQGGVIICRDVTERRRLEQRSQDVLEALLTMAHVMVQGDPSAANSDAQPRQAMCRTALQLAQLTRRILGCERLAITTLDSESNLLRPLAVVGLSAEQEREWWARLEQNPSSLANGWLDILDRLYAKELLVIDMREEPFNSRPNPYGVCSMLVAPLHVNDQILGILTLDYGETDHVYTEQEMQLTKVIAELVALVIERERLLHERAQAEANALAAQESTRLMDAFIGIAGHELRTPLTTIKGNIQLVNRQVSRMLQQQDTLPAEVAKQFVTIRGLLERAEHQAGVQNRLVKDLVDVSRIHSDHLELRIELCDLVDIVRQAVESQRLINPTRTIELLVEVPQLFVQADMDRVEQVLHNYVSNALKYSESTMPVEVCVMREGMNAKVLVRDQGPGLTPDQQKHIWERFHRVEGIQVKSGFSVGLGLGLHISQTVIERHGGQVGVESIVGQGSTFWFTLPLSDR